MTMGPETEAEQARLLLDARVRAQTALLRAAEELQTQLDERGILTVIATQLAGVVPYNEGLSVYMLSPDGMALRPVYADGPFAADVLAEPPTSIHDGISGSVARSGRARLENDALWASDARVVEGTDDESQNLLAVPLRSRSRVLGVLLIYRSLDWPFVPDDLDLAQLFANQAAIAIENAHLLRRERERADALEELDRLRADFVSTISHELRTPLTSIIGFTENLQAYWPRMSDDKKLEMVGKIKLSSRRLERFVRDLVYTPQVESGNLPLQLGPVGVAGAVAIAVQEIEGKHRGEVIQVAPPARPVTVLADQDRLCQVLVNLLDNAIKYSVEGSPVVVRWETEESVMTLAVQDHGQGIAAKDMPRLFTRFGKIGTAVRTGQSGTGLGLYISRGLVEAMKGNIAVESAPGAGSTFTITLPLAPDAPPR